MKDFVNSSALTKLLANAFIFMVLLTSLAIAGYDTLMNLPINAYSTALIGGGLTYAVGILGMHVGGVQALQAQAQSADTSSQALQAAAQVVQHPPTPGAS